MLVLWAAAGKPLADFQPSGPPHYHYIQDGAVLRKETFFSLLPSLPSVQIFLCVLL
jgi:hypothetical protein